MKLEKSLLKKCINKDERSMNDLYRLCFSTMKQISIRYQKNSVDVDEAINSGFLKIINNLSTYDDSKSFEAWFKKILINTNIDLYRKSKRHNEQVLYVENFTDFKETNVQFDTPPSNNKYAELLRMVKELPPMTRNVFNLFAIDGYSHQEIGEILDISDGTSKWHVSNARKKLKRKVEAKSKIIAR